MISRQVRAKPNPEGAREREKYQKGLQLGCHVVKTMQKLYLLHMAQTLHQIRSINLCSSLFSLSFCWSFVWLQVARRISDNYEAWARQRGYWKKVQDCTCNVSSESSRKPSPLSSYILKHAGQRQSCDRQLFTRNTGWPGSMAVVAFSFFSAQGCPLAASPFTIAWELVAISADPPSCFAPFASSHAAAFPWWSLAFPFSCAISAFTSVIDSVGACSPFSIPA